MADQPGGKNSGGAKGRPTPGRRDRAVAAQALVRRRRRARFATVLAGVILVVAVGVLAVTAGRSSSAGSVTDPAHFDLPRLAGTGRIRLADFRGKPLVVNFFASWCTACDSELPGFAHISEATRGRVQFVGVNALETGDRMFMPRRHHITWWPLARDVGGAQGSGLHDALGGGNGMPITAFYNSNGKLLEVERAALPESTLAEQLQKLYGVKV